MQTADQPMLVIPDIGVVSEPVPLFDKPEQDEGEKLEDFEARVADYLPRAHITVRVRRIDRIKFQTWAYEYDRAQAAEAKRAKDRDPHSTMVFSEDGQVELLALAKTLVGMALAEIRGLAVRLADGSTCDLSELEGDLLFDKLCACNFVAYVRDRCMRAQRPSAEQRDCL